MEVPRDFDFFFQVCLRSPIELSEANRSFGALSPAELIDAVIRPAMLKQEAEINQRVQQALHYGFETLF